MTVLFGRVAEVFVSDEERLTVFIGILGATAYFPLLARALQDATQELGFPADHAAQVATPGGTTIAGPEVFATAGLAGLVEDAIRASIARAIELNQE